MMSALVVALAINATDYYISGIGGWAEPGTKAELQLVGESDVLTCNFARIDAGAEFKVFANAGWDGPQYGAAVENDAITPNGEAYTLATQNAKNLKIALAEKHYLTDAVISVNTTTWAVTVTGTDVDGSQEADVYCLVGACTDNWNPTVAIEFVDVEGVLTATVPNLNGGFKLIKNHQWGWEAAANGSEALGFNTPMTLVTAAGGNNINLANPFGGYNNAVLTLDVTNADAPVLTLVGGEFAMGEAHWYFPGEKLGWKCDESTEFEPVAGKENTFEFLMAEFGKDFKVVFGNWGVEFGAPKDAEKVYWTTNEPMELVTPCANVYATDDNVVLNDVIATIVVDYEAITCVLTLEVEETAFEQIAAGKDAVKVIENGKVVVIKNGVRYSVKGAKL